MITYKTKDMILTTTPTVEGRTIIEYKGIVFGEVITGVNFLKDIGAGLRNIFGGRSGSYEQERGLDNVKPFISGHNPSDARLRRSRDRRDR